MRVLKVDVIHIPRDQNALANKLAKWSVSQPNVFIGDQMPDC